MSDIARPRTILVVEDDELNLKLFRDTLELAGYSVTEAVTAEDGLIAAREKPPDLILMDVQLPGMDGVEAVRILKADVITSSIPVLAVTGYAMTEDMKRGLGAGFDEYMTKPLDRADLLGAIQKHLRD